MLLCHRSISRPPTYHASSIRSHRGAICPVRSRVLFVYTSAVGRSGGAGHGSGEQPFDERARRALREAAEILSEAQELAQQQARDELLSSWQLGSATTEGTAPQQSSATAIQAFLVEQGLQKPQAAALLKVLHSDEQFSSCLSTEVLQQKLSSLQRVLPEADTAALVLDEPRLLLTSSQQLVTNLVALVQAFPGRDVMGMVTRRPCLLLVTDMVDRVARIMKKLVQLHPSHSVKVVSGIIEENPTLLERMDYYLSDDLTLIDELPIEIQNMMVLGDESGVGFLYRYWRDKLQQPADQ